MMGNRGSLKLLFGWAWRPRWGKVGAVQGAVQGDDASIDALQA
jgi:hypothetical protein